MKQGEMFALLAILFLLMVGFTKSSCPPCPPCNQDPQIVQIPSDLKFIAGKAVPEKGANALLVYVSDNIAPKIDKELEKDPNLNVIEVIGHTDYLAVRGTSNLDQELLHTLANFVYSDSQDFDELVTKFDALRAGSKL